MPVIDAFAHTPSLFIGSVFILSLLIGSFLNVVVHRLPIMLDRQWREQAHEILCTPALAAGSTATSGQQPPAPGGAPAPRFNLIVPRSACPSCGVAIRAWQNVPLVSYLLLRGRCASCKTRISLRYPVVELLTAALSAVVAWRFGVTWFTLGALALTWSLITLAAIDIDHQILPDSITLPLVWFGLAVSLWSAGSDGYPVAPRSSILGAAAGYLSLWLVFHAFRLLTGKEGMGYGDFKLFAALGAWLGWQMLPLIILLSALAGATVGIALIIILGRDRNVPIPFGPYLAAAGWIALVWGESIVGGYLRFSGLADG